MQVWELQLLVRKKACEGRLADLRERHGNVILVRNRSPLMGPSWHRKDDKLAWIRYLIRRELEEIRHVKTMLRVGPIVGNSVVLWVKSGVTKKPMPGPTILDIMDREAERWLEKEKDGEFDVASVAHGINIATEILNNPYRFLNDDEKAAFREAEDQQDAIIENRAGEPKVQPAGKPGPSLDQIRANAADQNVVVRRRKS